MGRFIFVIFLGLAVFLSTLVGTGNKMTVFIAVLTLFWHSLVYIYCLFISQYRFKNPKAKYVKIKNKLISKIFVHSVEINGVPLANDSETKMNIIGFVLNIVNVLLLVLFEILLFIPKIPCDTYEFRLIVPRALHGADRHGILLNSLNEIIPAEVSRIFAIAVTIVFFVFLALFERQPKERRRKIKRNTIKFLCKKVDKNRERYYPLYVSLVNISVRKNNKKHKCWYNEDQIEQIEDLVKTAFANAELQFETKENRLVSFTVVDTMNNRVVFTGYFI